MLYNALIAAIRTGVAAVVGFVVTWAVARGVEFPDGFDVLLTAGLFSAATVAYNALVNLLATKVHPAFGYLLGVPKTPEYEPVVVKDSDGRLVATDYSALPTGEQVVVAPPMEHDPDKVDNAEPHPYLD